MTPAKSGMCLAFLAEKRKKMNRKNNDRKRRNPKSRKDVIMPVSASENQMPDSYSVFLGNLKERIQQERLKVVLSANAALVMMYWDIGRSILQKQNNEGWGAKVIDRLSLVLKYAFPEMSGFSPRNLKYMRKFAESWPDRGIVQEVLAQITWYHNLALLEKVKEPELRVWYARQTFENGWSRNVLVFQIETRLHERIGQTTKFHCLMSLSPACRPLRRLKPN